MTPDELHNSIQNGCDALGQTVGAPEIRQFAALLVELEHWSDKINLTAIRDIGDMISGHLLDSLTVRPFLHGSRIIDIGTGAGFPGLPLAIVEPARSFVLLDGNGKKINFVKHIVAKLGLRNVDALKVRAEDYAPARAFDTVVARALATIPRIIEIGGHLTAQKGVLLALKGRYPDEELELADKQCDPWSWSVERVSVPGLEQHSRHVVRLSKKG